MVNTILAIVSMVSLNIEAWMVRDLGITEAQITQEFNKSRIISVDQKLARSQERTLRLLRDTDVLLLQVAAYQQAQARKAAAEQEAKAKQKQYQVD